MVVVGPEDPLVKGVYDFFESDPELTSIPVIGVPINASLDGMDALLAIVQMPPGIPVATVGINASLNAAILALQILATDNSEYQAKLIAYKEGLKDKITQANKELSEVKFKNKTN